MRAQEPPHAGPHANERRRNSHGPRPHRAREGHGFLVSDLSDPDHPDADLPGPMERFRPGSWSSVRRAEDCRERVHDRGDECVVGPDATLVVAAVLAGSRGGGRRFPGFTGFAVGRLSATIARYVDLPRRSTGFTHPRRCTGKMPVRRPDCQARAPAKSSARAVTTNVRRVAVLPVRGRYVADRRADVGRVT